MAIVDLTYYNNTYLGEPVATADFPRLEKRAEQVIASICRGQYETMLAQLNGAAAEALTTAYKSAICAQIEYYQAGGYLSVSTGQSGESFTVGKVSVTAGGSGSSFATRGAAMLSPTAQMYLEQTGLLGRAVAVPVEPFAPFPWEII